MARVDMTPVQIDRTGTAVVTAAVYITSDGAAVLNNSDKMFVYLHNTDVSAIVVTIDMPNLVDGQAITDKTISLDASEAVLLGPWPAQYYNQDAGKVNFDAATADKVEIQAYYI